MKVPYEKVRHSIKQKLAVILLSFGLLPACIAGGISFYFARNLSMKYSMDVTSITDRVDASINVIFDEVKGQITAYSKNILFSDVSLTTPGEDFVTISQALRDYQESHANFSFFWVSDNERNIVGSTHSSFIGEMAPNIEPYNNTIRDGQIHQGPIVQITIPGGVNAMGFWTFAPLYPAWGSSKPIGVMGAFYSYEGIDKLVKSEKIDGSEQDNEKYVDIIFDEPQNQASQGQAAEDYGRDRQKMKFLFNKVSISKNKKGIIEGVEDPWGTKVVGYSKNSLHKYTVVSLVSEDIVYRRLGILQRTLTLTFVCIVFAIIVLIFPISRIFTSPVLRLKESAMELAKGDLKYPIDTRGNDEIGELAKSFSFMRDSINSRIQDLKVLNLTGEKLAEAGQHQQVFRKVLEILLEKTNFQNAYGYLYDPDKKNFELINKINTNYEEFDINSLNIVNNVSQKKVFYINTHEVPRLREQGMKGKFICIPLMDNNNDLGIILLGDHRDVNQSFDAMDEEFFETLARLAVINIKNINMLHIIEEQNKNLEKKVEERTHELNIKTTHLNTMLQNLGQGIFSITKGNIIHPEYSSYLEKILETDHLEYTNVMDKVFSNTNLSGDNMNMLASSLHAIIGENSISYVINGKNLPRECVKSFGDRKKVLEFDWNSIVGMDDTTENLLVTIRDITHVRELQETTNKQKTELEIIGQILACTVSKFWRFSSRFKKLLKAGRDVMNLKEEYDEKRYIEKACHILHTLKGNSRICNLTHLSNMVHNAEDQLMKNDLNLNHQGFSSLLSSLLDAIEAQYSVYENIALKLAGSEESSEKVVKFSHELYSKAMSAFMQIDQNGSIGPAAIDALKEFFLASGVSLRKIIAELDSEIKNISFDCGKEIPKIRVFDEKVLIPESYRDMIRDIMIHLFTNSLDHGIEYASKREDLRKPISGTIVIEARCDNENIQIVYYDDGPGLNVQQICKKTGLSSGGTSSSHKITPELLSTLIFNPGFSTAEKVTLRSGRGIGLSAVKELLEEVSGDISIKIEGNPGTDEFCPFKIVMKLPLIPANGKNDLDPVHRRKLAA
ncbi:MAG: HAMP domain-containing protein [Oligoflexales bacterium]|nr:HAMP domain-containing protein [Oligoflexales bacterium]